MAIMVVYKYGILRILSTIFKVLAIATLLIGIISTIKFLAATAQPGIPGVATSIILFGLNMTITYVIVTICLWACAELIILFIDLEENTRRTTLLLEKERS